MDVGHFETVALEAGRRLAANGIERPLTLAMSSHWPDTSSLA